MRDETIFEKIFGLVFVGLFCCIGIYIGIWVFDGVTFHYFDVSYRIESFLIRKPYVTREVRKKREMEKEWEREEKIEIKKRMRTLEHFKKMI